MKQSPLLFVCNTLSRFLEKTKYVLEPVFKQKYYLNCLLLEYIQLSSLLNSIVRKFLFQMKDLVSNHDLNFIGFKICHLLFDYERFTDNTEIFFLRDRSQSEGSTSRS